MEPFIKPEGVEGDAGALENEGFGKGDGLTFFSGGSNEVDGNDFAVSLNEEVDWNARKGVFGKGLPANGTECGGQVGESRFNTPSLA